MMAEGSRLYFAGKQTLLNLTFPQHILHLALLPCYIPFSIFGSCLLDFSSLYLPFFFVHTPDDITV